MHNTITGSFEVKLTPQALSFEHSTALNAGRMNIDKSFHGKLEGHSKGEMLSVLDGERKAGGYVAVEVFEGTLDGRKGSFALQHYGQMSAQGQLLTLEVVPNSGSGELLGIKGKMKIRIEDKQHFYDFEYEL